MSGLGHGLRRATVFNARNLCPKTHQFLPWVPGEQALTLCANSSHIGARLCDLQTVDGRSQGFSGCRAWA